MIEFTGAQLTLSSQVENYGGYGLSRDRARACMVADTLAWAVRHGIPLPDALKSLPFTVRLPSPSLLWRGRFKFLRDFFIPFRPFFWLVNTRWSWNVQLLIQDLEKGEPLSSALERNLGRRFPGFYLMGLAKAEAEKRLDTALPLLARQLNFPASVASERKFEFYFAGFKILIASYILLIITVMIVPRFEVIFSDLLASPPIIMGPVAAIAAAILKIGIFAIVVVFILSRLEGIGEFVILHIPFVGRERRRFILSDLARSMAVFMRQGEDILSAAEWSMKATRSHWLRKKLETFVDALRNGADWVEAWARMNLGAPLDQWLISNAAARQDPASGFELLGEWLHQEIEFTTRRLERWIDPICTLAIAAVVGGIAYYIFSALTEIIVSLAS